ncbi:unnamed protein product [Echinostoma caproni]|uniref:PKcGMP_CC domain-containing protein n=1 Tax=Echinostoma caproni TaxID=27848 RepID=A0A183A0V2_9TREM|nr:unnamed protein product [Echinostoma caproni]
MDGLDTRRNSPTKGLQTNDAVTNDASKSVGKDENRTNEASATKVTNKPNGKAVDDMFTVELAALKERVRQLEEEIKSVELRGLDSRRLLLHKCLEPVASNRKLRQEGDGRIARDSPYRQVSSRGSLANCSTRAAEANSDYVPYRVLEGSTVI